jgi:hypothetical protein
MFNLLSNKLILLSIKNESFVQITGEPLSTYFDRNTSHHYHLKKKNYMLKVPKEFKKKKESISQPSLKDTQPVMQKQVISESKMELESSDSTVISGTPETDSECDSFIILIECTPDEEELKLIRESKKESELKAFEIPKELDLSKFPQDELKLRKKKKNKRQRNKINKESVKEEKGVKNNSNIIKRNEMLYSRNFKIINQFPKDRNLDLHSNLYRCIK